MMSRGNYTLTFCVESGFRWCTQSLGCEKLVQSATVKHIRNILLANKRKREIIFMAFSHRKTASYSIHLSGLPRINLERETSPSNLTYRIRCCLKKTSSLADITAYSENNLHSILPCL